VFKILQIAVIKSMWFKLLNHILLITAGCTMVLKHKMASKLLLVFCKN